MAAPKLTYYFDIVSPFAYIAFSVLRNSPTFAKCNITYVPIFLGGLMQKCENRPPLVIKNKNKYIERQRIDLARRFGVQILAKTPDGFPQLSLTTMRVIYAIKEIAPEKFLSVLELVWKSYWVEGDSSIFKVDGLKPVIEPILGPQTTEQVFTMISDPKVKAALAANVDKAYEARAFGVPWFVCTNSKGETEGFWGVDHLGFVAEYLGLDKSLDQGFKALL